MPIGGQRIHGIHKVFHNGIELGFRGLHAAMYLYHGIAGISTGATGNFTKLLNQLFPKTLHVGICKLMVIQGVVANLFDKFISQSFDAFKFVQLLVKVA